MQRCTFRRIAAAQPYPPGTPSWADVSAPDLDAAASFYAGLLGWEASAAGPAEQTGGYRMFTLGGRVVAGLGPTMQGGPPPLWTTYVSVDSADDTVAKAADAGGAVFLAPMDVLDVGRMAVFADPTGAAIAIWQPRAHRGAEVLGEVGSLCWTELATRDPEAAKRFYATVFGWGAATSDMGGASYTEWQLGDRSVAGMIEMDDTWPAQAPPYWLPYFAVADTDEAARRAQELGGRVLVEPTSIQPGRFAVIADPHGATFAVIALAPAA